LRIIECLEVAVKLDDFAELYFFIKIVSVKMTVIMTSTI